MSALPQLCALSAPLPQTSLALLAQPRLAAASAMAHVEHDDAGTVPACRFSRRAARASGARHARAASPRGTRHLAGIALRVQLVVASRASSTLSTLRADCRRRFAEAPTSEQLSSGLLFFGNRLCPFAHRAWLAMHEKGVADEVIRHYDSGAAGIAARLHSRLWPAFQCVLACSAQQ